MRENNRIEKSQGDEKWVDRLRRKKVEGRMEKEKKGARVEDGREWGGQEEGGKKAREGKNGGERERKKQGRNGGDRR